jgi:hypothetical protein
MVAGCAGPALPGRVTASACRLRTSYTPSAMHARTNPRSRYSVLFCAVALVLTCGSLFVQDAIPSHAATVFDSMRHARKIDQVALSPDGTQVAFIVNGQLAVIPADGGSSHAIAVEGCARLYLTARSSGSRNGSRKHRKALASLAP